LLTLHTAKVGSNLLETFLSTLLDDDAFGLTSPADPLIKLLCPVGHER
jgi:hypothetical protein